VEYDESGAVKGQIKSIPKSKYVEDVFTNNHRSVFGSWWSNFQWGYQCCHSLVKNSYCTGEEGKEAFEQAEKMRIGELLLDDADSNRDRTENDNSRPTQANGEAESEPSGARKRTLQEMRQGVTEEELEAYKRSRSAVDDPMAKYLGKDEAVY
jgi:pre-mRNA-processing factor SLU7